MPRHDGFDTKMYLDLAVLVYRLVCQPVTLESWVRFPDAAAKLPPHPHLGGLPFLDRIFGSAVTMKFLFPACVHCEKGKYHPLFLKCGSVATLDKLLYRMSYEPKVQGSSP